MRLSRARSIVCVLSMIAPSACSDDGVPQGDASEGAGEESTTSGTSVTTTGTVTNSSSDSLTASSTDNSGTTDPSGSATLGEGTSSDDGSTGPVGTSEGTTGDPVGDCVDADGCQLVEDCCNCVVIPVGADPPACDIDECPATACADLGVPAEAICELGSCELAPVPCNPYDTTCKDPPPECPEGTVPGVDVAAQCWTGTCVPAEACDVVPDCDVCPDDETCVEFSTQLGPYYVCSPVDPSCGGTPSCACMGAAVCTAPFDACGDGEDGLSCSCPVC